ncbi:MAG: hypothetical protein RM022_029215 [Nostoc sp. EfeVER01]|uniref:hypothetical protein n=1 Tax=unclassified Nostoc TaxID=2593658 RepID=UPI002AD4B977|nr:MULTISPECIES: hypothetical protein [unclassified Nostoc]MDZ7945015.1 hypothetical protein [Nostoc sp. EfeVER01]MDZ7991612.1 hypothetical protein [Nostoc sp. EspVER01]
MSQSPKDKTVVAWQEALKVSICVFIPAFVLMVVASFLFNPAQVNMFKALQREQVEKEVKKQLGEEIKKQVQEEVKSQVAAERSKIFDGQKALLNLDKESPLGRTYISGEINKQVKEEAEKVAKDEISQAKGDLFGQITFPVIFTIASIFAAFAVKDILTEVLKEQERDRIKRDIETNLRNDLKSEIVPKLVDKENKNTTKKLQEIEGYVNWLEHQILNIIITEVIDELKKNNVSEINREFSLAIKKLSDRSIATLDKSSVKFSKGYFQQIKVCEDSVLNFQLKSTALNKDSKNTLTSIFDNSRQKGSEQEEFYEGESIFQAQMGLLIITLRKLVIAGQDSSEVTNLINKVFQEITTDPVAKQQENLTIVHELEEDGVQP